MTVEDLVIAAGGLLESASTANVIVTRRVKATVGFGAGVGAFKTALWQMGVFNTNQMREPVQPLEGEDVEAIVAILKKEGMLDPDAPVRA